MIQEDYLCVLWGQILHHPEPIFVFKCDKCGYGPITTPRGEDTYKTMENEGWAINKKNGVVICSKCKEGD